MNKTVPWSIKGVGPDTREAAKEAARRSGVSLGEWLDGIIAAVSAMAVCATAFPAHGLVGLRTGSHCRLLLLGGLAPHGM